MVAKFLSAISVLAAVVAFTVAPSRAAVIVTDATTIDSISGVATFVTPGNQLSGMSVTVVTNLGTETHAWSVTGADSGHAVGTGWEISVTGDTFNINAWTATQSGGAVIQSILLEGVPGLVLFDRTGDVCCGGEPGTPGSAQGRDFSSTLVSDALVTATYSHEVQINANVPVGDEWHTLFLDFSDDAVQEELALLAGFNFNQDADNDVTRPAPEPASAALLGLGLAALGFVRRRRQ